MGAETFNAVWRKHLQKEFSHQELKTWVDPLEIMTDERGEIRIRFPHQLFAGWFEESVRERFEARLGEILAPGVRLVYENAPGGEDARNKGPSQATATTEQAFGRRFTFASFLVNSKNFFPVESAKEVARQGHERFNPFVVCGESGSGKTHLIRAMANTLARRSDPGALFLGSPTNVSQYVGRHCAGDWQLARHRLDRYMYLFLDDLHQVAGDGVMQVEFGLLVDRFLEQDKQVVCSLAGGVTAALGQHLASRLSSGLIVDLKRPDLAIRLKYAQRINKVKGLRLNKDQCLTLAQRFPDMRGLQGVMLKIGVFRNVVHRELEDKDFLHILSHTESVSGEGLTPDSLMREAAELFSVSVEELKGKSRNRRIVDARQAAMFVMRKMLGCSYPVLGKMFGGKDHSTVMHAVKKMEQVYSRDGTMKTRLVELKKRCQALEKGEL